MFVNNSANFSNPYLPKEQRRKRKTAVTQAAIEGAANGAGLGIGAGYLVRKSKGLAKQSLMTSIRREKLGFMLGGAAGAAYYGTNEYKNQYPKVKKPKLIKPKNSNV